MATQRIDFIKAKEIMDAAPGLVILDVRSEEEYITGHAVDALNLPVDAIDESSIKALVPDLSTPFMVYCRSGRRSAVAAEKLDSYGYTVYDVGSLAGWPYGLE